jgi:hypothetical protein
MARTSSLTMRTRQRSADPSLPAARIRACIASGRVVQTVGHHLEPLSRAMRSLRRPTPCGQVAALWGVGCKPRHRELSSPPPHAGAHDGARRTASPRTPAGMMRVEGEAAGHHPGSHGQPGRARHCPGRRRSHHEPLFRIWPPKVIEAVTGAPRRITGCAPRRRPRPRVADDQPEHLARITGAWWKGPLPPGRRVRTPPGWALR